MHINDFLKIQQEFDSNHGWLKDDQLFETKINYINKDIIGIVGELGEFSNIIKKINLDLDAGLVEEALSKFTILKPNLKEELIDIFIYLLRIIHHIDINIEEEYLKKLEFNKERFKFYEHKKY